MALPYHTDLNTAAREKFLDRLERYHYIEGKRAMFEVVQVIRKFFPVALIPLKVPCRAQSKLAVLTSYSPPLTASYSRETPSVKDFNVFCFI
jgi:hypothetical protein